MTKIPYCKETWPLTAGCTKCSPGCENDWAERMAKRLKGKGIRGYDIVVDKDGWTNHIELMPWNLDKPLHWKQPRRIFVNSMSDLFHSKVPFEFIDKVFDVMRRTPNHTYLVFTKRPERMADFIYQAYGVNHRLDNAWLGVSISTSLEMWKADILEKIPATIRFVSLEPLLEDVPLKIGKLNWVIVGGESGPKARPMQPDWARSIRDQCVATGVPFYFKQWGEWWPENQIDSYVVHCSHPPFRFEDGLKSFRVGKKKAGDLLDGKEWKQYP